MDELKKLTRLGQDTPYVDQYDPKQLTPVPRALSRDSLPGEPSWHGYDEWWGYELSWLNSKGRPEVRMVRFRFSPDSPFLIESKSFKLYLNSFNQTRFSDERAVRERLVEDLSSATGQIVDVLICPVQSLAADASTTEEGGQFECTLLDTLDVEVDVYTPSASLLEKDDSGPSGGTWVSHLLRSNCPVTGQPDWGSVLIHLEGAACTQESLLRYIISYRQHQGFHEHCVESMYTDLMHKLKPEKLMVMARYTRRGGLDINPVRASHPELLDVAEKWGRVNRQ
ncbi:MAG: NADPH-dependent 7-cyano-7-deazaguanine reductase QueF [Gammaproteobacteria bacterium]|nr:MAG: NADPH-dependent 7-cyano-7-deazaguanine reductase QueF [Gammaproteobacteria bacterium]